MDVSLTHRDSTSQGRPDPGATHVIWGSELSPFALKLRALCEAAAIPYAWLPDEGSRLQNWRIALAIDRAKRRRTVLRYPAMDDLDEYPLVPYLVEPSGRIQYDTSAIARWIDAEIPTANPLFPVEPALGFVAMLVDEAFDEVGLYLVHHNRWVLSAATNDAGARLAHEQRRVLLPGMGRRFGRWFAQRQVRRLPYLFSVAPEGFTMAGVAAELTPPSVPGFPPTHALLDEIWEDIVRTIDDLLRKRPYLLGERFTIADASVYGQLSMNLKDPSANDRMAQIAPRMHAWLLSIRDGSHRAPQGSLGDIDLLRPLVDVIGETFVPLMQQNERAHHIASTRGERVLNEPAFDRRSALFEGTLRGRPFRSVAKTFQVRVWRDLRVAWKALAPSARDELARVGVVSEWFEAPEGTRA